MQPAGDENYNKIVNFVKRINASLKDQAEESVQPTLTHVHSLAPKEPMSNEFVTIRTKDGKETKFAVFTSITGEKFIDSRALLARTGMCMYDPGYANTASCMSAISYCNSDGVLLYRGYKIEDLVKTSSFMEVCFLLMYSELPSQDMNEAFPLFQTCPASSHDF